MNRARNSRSAFSLIEILIVIVILSVVAVAAIPSTSATGEMQLQSAAQMVAAQLQYARDLAQTYSSEYRIDFASDGTKMTLSHDGSSSSLDTLPTAPFSNIGGSSTTQVFWFNELAGQGVAVTIGTVRAVGSSETEVDAVVFESLGNTTRSETTRLWLTLDQGSEHISIPIEINPVTGLVTVGDLIDGVADSLDDGSSPLIYNVIQS